MISSTAKLSFSSLVLLLLFKILQVNDQSLQKAADKINSCKNITYTDVVQTRFSFQDVFSSETLLSRLSNSLKGESYYSLSSTQNAYLFDGNKLFSLNLSDSTYKVQEESVNGQNTRTLLYWAKEMATFNKPKKTSVLDTPISGILYDKIKVTKIDTVENREHYYHVTNYIIDKKSHLPYRIERQIRGKADDDSIFGLTEIHTYSGYKLDQTNFPDLTRVNISNHFMPQKASAPVEFLPNGTRASVINGYGMAGERLDWNKLKGKTVLLNFSLLGCPHCVAATKMLNDIYEQYKEKNLIIVNLFPIDKKDAVIKYNKRENVKSPSYIVAKDVQKSYPYDGYPSFYLIDKKGMVAEHFDGYYKELPIEILKNIERINR